MNNNHTSGDKKIDESKRRGFWRAKYTIPLVVLLIALGAYAFWSKEHNLKAVPGEMADGAHTLADDVKDKVHEAGEALSEMGGKMKEGAADLADDAKEGIHRVGESLSEAGREVKEGASDLAEDASDKAHQAGEALSETASEAKQDVKDLAKDAKDKARVALSTVIEPLGAKKKKLNDYSFPAGKKAVALRQNVDKYASAGSNECSGYVTVATKSKHLNVRTGPSTAHVILSEANDRTKHSVVMWAWDERVSSRTDRDRWFLIEDNGTIEGWVSGRYCNTSHVDFME